MRIGTILHGALGDVYEQALSFRLLHEEFKDHQLIAFFAKQDRLEAFKHFKLDMFDEIHPASKLETTNIDIFKQFQIKDIELKNDILDNLPRGISNKFDLNKNWLPWTVLRNHNFNKHPVKLELSEEGISSFKAVLEETGLTEELFDNEFTVGYLWRYRASGPQSAVKPYLQKPKKAILESKSKLFSSLIKKHNARIIIAGMGKDLSFDRNLESSRKDAGVLEGEINSKFASEKLDINSNRVTYLKGLGYAAEMEIIARTDLQILMPSGFSEPVWFRNTKRTLIVDAPPVYLLKMLKYRMPIFNNKNLWSFIYNNFNSHKACSILSEIKRRKLL